MNSKHKCKLNRIPNTAAGFVWCRLHARSRASVSPTCRWNGASLLSLSLCPASFFCGKLISLSLSHCRGFLMVKCEISLFSLWMRHGRDTGTLIDLLMLFVRRIVGRTADGKHRAQRASLLPWPYSTGETQGAHTRSTLTTNTDKFFSSLLCTALPTLSLSRFSPFRGHPFRFFHWIPNPPAAKVDLPLPAAPDLVCEKSRAPFLICLLSPIWVLAWYHYFIGGLSVSEEGE